MPNFAILCAPGGWRKGWNTRNGSFWGEGQYWAIPYEQSTKTRPDAFVKIWKDKYYEVGVKAISIARYLKIF